jgi:predicted porin
MHRVSKWSVVMVLSLAALGLAAQNTGTVQKVASTGTNSASAEEVQQLRGEVAAQRKMIEDLQTTIHQLAESPLAKPEAANDIRNLKLVTATLQSEVPEETKAKEKKALGRTKDHDAVEFSVGGGKFQIYGHGDVSYDYVDNGLSAARELAGGVLAPDVARSNNGWLSQISSNTSYLGFRGSRPFNHYLSGVFQIETEVNFSGTPGPTADLQCKQCIGSRDTYVGMQGPWGALKIGKSDAPYKKASSPLDPFINTIGDNRSIMGNSGGDNRAEFATRISHAVWYESPIHKGLSAAVLFSPGQNRASDTSAYARGEPNCSGGNGAFTLSPQNQANVVEGANLTTLAGAAGLTLDPCQDGSWGSLVSTMLAYKGKGLYVFGAYEHHSDVNRQVDYPTGLGVADEAAWKLGAQYTFKKTGTTGDFTYEKLKRYSPADPAFNERSRPNAFWTAITQKIDKNTDFNLGWAFAGKTPGDPDLGFGGLPANTVNNRSNLYDIGLKHRFASKMSAYFVFARQANHGDAHYDLGAVGHGIQVDKRDFLGNGFKGTTLQGVSGGMTYDF